MSIDVSIDNKRYELSFLVKAYLKRASSINYGGYGYNSFRSSNSPITVHSVREIDDVYKTRIYFYELSDLNRIPLCFTSVDQFKAFLSNNGLSIDFRQEMIIRNLGTVYASCYEGIKDINLRGSYKNLKDSMKEKGGN